MSNIQFIKATRIDHDSVEATYSLNETEFTVKWCRLDHNGKIDRYDLDADCECSDSNLAIRVAEAIKEGETDENPDLDLYLTVRDVFDSTDCEDFEVKDHILDICANYDEENTESDVEVKAIVDKEEVEVTFHVQLSCGKYESQNGCWITTTWEDLEFDEDEEIVFNLAKDEIINAAEAAFHRLMNDKYIDYDTNFNCALNDCNLVAREKKETRKVTLVMINSSHNSVSDYGSKEEERETFNNIDEAMKFLEQFRTDDHHDFAGLHAYLNHKEE